MKHNREPWMDALETGPVPDSVQTKLNEAYASLPPRTRRRHPLAVAWRSAAALAACAAILCVTNFVNPVLAENLPVVGGLFQLLNDQPEDKKPWHVNEALEQIVVEPEQTDSNVTAENTFPFEVTLGETYYDGRYLGVTIQMKPQQEKWLAYDTFCTNATLEDENGNRISVADTSFCINGLQAYPVSAGTFEKASDGSYICLMTFDLYTTFCAPDDLSQAYEYVEDPDFPDTLDVRLALHNLAAYPCPVSAANWDPDSQIEGDWSAAFSVSKDSSLTRVYRPNQTVNGITLEKVEITAGSTMITLACADGEIPAHWTPTFPVDEQGNRYLWYRALEYSDGHLTMHTNRLPDDVKTLSFQMVNKNTDEVEAEFTFDLEHAQPAE